MRATAIMRAQPSEVSTSCFPSLSCFSKYPATRPAEERLICQKERRANPPAVPFSVANTHYHPLSSASTYFFRFSDGTSVASTSLQGTFACVWALTNETDLHAPLRGTTLHLPKL